MSKFLAVLRIMASMMAVVMLIASPVYGQDDEEDGSESSARFDLSNIFDFQKLSGMEARLAPYGDNLMGDMIDKNTGGISFEHTEVSLPGNSNLEVAFRRKISQGLLGATPFQQGFGDWVIDLPVAHVAYATGATTIPQPPAPVFDDGCLNNIGAMGRNVRVGLPHIGTTDVQPSSHLAGAVLYVPGKGLSGHPGPVKTLADPKSDWTSGARTTDHAGRCASVAIAPDGTKYKFGRHTFRRADDFDIPYVYESQFFDRTPVVRKATFHLRRNYAVYLITEVEDVNGNWVRYDYTSDNRAELTRIHSNDGRDIRVHYNSNIPTTWNHNSRWVSHITVNENTANERRWDYEYVGGGGLQFLQKAYLPDGRYWDFGETGLTPMRATVRSLYRCLPYAYSFDMKHPDGAVGRFSIRGTRHIKGATTTGDTSDEGGHYMRPMDIPHATDDSNCSGPVLPYFGWPIYRVMSLTSKTISGADIPTATWDFEYRDYDGGSLDQNWTKVTGPDGTERTYTHQAIGPDHGLLKSIEVKAAGETIDSISYEHNQTGEGASSGEYGECRADGEIGNSDNAGRCEVYKKRPITKMVQVRDGDTYTTDYTYDFDIASSPISVSRYSSATGSTVPRVTQTTYEDKLSNWILDLPKTVSMNGREEARATYNNLGQLTSYQRYGQANFLTYTYNSDGTLASMTDALQRRTEALNWKRGRPQHIKRAVGSPDEIDQYQYVDDNGWVTSQTDANGSETKYTHDNMGRLTKIDPPRAWDNTVINYDFPENGGAVQTITKGQAKTTVTYDSMYRTRLEKTEATDTGWVSYVNTTYDGLGRVIFTSQPSANELEIKGVETSYDGLGRMTQSRETVASNATTDYEYLDLHRRRVTDPSGAYTIHWSYGYAGPGNEDYRRISQYDSGGTLLRRTDLLQNEYGQMTRLRQRGDSAGVSSNRSQLFYYDDNQRLCRHYVNEHGATTYEYDIAGQMVAYAKGQSNSGCGTVADVPEKVNLTYDDLGRLKETDFLDAATPDITRSYDANSNLLTLNRGEGLSAVNWTYTYNDANLMTRETLNVEHRVYRNVYQYNWSGHRDYERTPYQIIRNQMDGLGRILSVTNKDGDVTYASNVQYDQTGGVHQMTYGNDYYHSQTLNDRLLPERVMSYSGTTKAIDQTLTYDARGLITSILDGAVSGNDRFYGYDGLGQLTSANGPWGANGANADGSYIYDSLGNLRRKTLGTRRVDLFYDTNNRVNRSLDTGQSGDRTIAYDTRGNVTTLGTLAFIYDMSDQPTTVTGSSTGEAVNASYIYDGNMKRVKSVINGKTIYNIYNAAGRLVTVHKLTDGERIDYINGPTGTLARIDRQRISGAWVDDITYLHPDHLGSAQSGSKADGTIAWREQYTPFGEELQSPAANDNLGGFTGHIRDKATGLNYMQARYYDPVIGRFLSIDPVTFMDTGVPAQFNRYSYTFNDPINLFDPDGENPARRGTANRGPGGAIYSSPGTQIRFEAAYRRNNELADLAFGPGTPRISPTYKGTINSRHVRQLERANEVLENHVRSQARERIEGESGGPGEGKRFPSEGPQIRESMEGIPCAFCKQPTTNRPGRPNSRERDHSDAKSQGGNNSARNENQSCRTCNRRKGILEGETFRQKIQRELGE